MGIWQGLCASGSSVYLTWKGEAGDDRLFLSIFDTGTKTWSGQGNVVPGNSSVGPGCAMAGDGLLHVAWKGRLNDPRLFYTWYDPRTKAWQPQILVENTVSDLGPSLAAIADTVYAGFTGTQGSTNLLFAAFQAGTVEPLWLPLPLLPANPNTPETTQSAIGPSLAAVGQTLYAAWTDLNGVIHWAAYDTSTQTWSTPLSMGGPQSSIGPSLAAVGSTVYAAWRGGGNNSGMFYNKLDTTQPNPTWTGQRGIPSKGSSIGPALAASGHTLYAVWVGAGGDAGLYYSSLDTSKNAATWSPYAPLGGNTGQDFVPPPPTGLVSSWNYPLTVANGAPIIGLSVTIDILQDVVVPNGSFDFQLNADPPAGSTLGWQQFVVGFDPSKNVIGCSIELFDPSRNSIFNHAGTLCAVSDVSAPSSFTLPAGSRYIITLYDDGENITGAYFTFSAAGKGPFEPLLLLTGGIGAPIADVQINMTGTSGGATVNLQQGAGRFTYVAPLPLTAVPITPAYATQGNRTLEKSNAFYGGIVQGAAISVQQGFGVTP